MTVLRSREVVPVKTLKKRVMSPSTTSKSNEPPVSQSSLPFNSQPSVQVPDPDAQIPDSGLVSGSGSNLRRSLRIAARLSSSEVPAVGESWKTKGVPEVEGGCSDEGSCESGPGNARGRVLGSDSVGEEDGVLEMKDGVEMAKRSSRELSVPGVDCKEEAERKDMVTVKRSRGKRKFSNDASPVETRFLGLRSGKKIVKERMGEVDRIESDVGKAVNEGESGGEYKEGGNVQSGGRGEGIVKDLVNDPGADEDGNVDGSRRFTQEEKGKGKLIEGDISPDGIDAVKLDLNSESEGKNVLANENGDENDAVQGHQRYSREEKGKGVTVDGNLPLNAVEPLGLSLESKVRNSVAVAVANSYHLAGDVRLQVQNQVTNTNTVGNASRARARFRNIARQNASRLAHSLPEEEMENRLSHEAGTQIPAEDGVKENEDWPGPFSTAMKIIRDREKQLNRQQNSGSERNKPAHITWSPRKDKNVVRSRPTLLEMCIEVLVQNADAIKSLDNIPDTLRHKISQSLCDSRKMNSHILELLVCGPPCEMQERDCPSEVQVRDGPSEVQVRDCSWLTEEEFSRIFGGCDTSNLKVLQLDHCGRCLTENVLRLTFPLLSNSFPALTAVSLKGACRLSDEGLGKLVSSAPALRSINLSQCSLLTSASIITLAESLGSVLRKLYIDDCQSIDPLRILPALKKLKYLEVLSVAGIQDVCDKFISEFIEVQGATMAELFLTDCVTLTDASLKAIAERCSELRALDLGNLGKLTDSAVGYLANGCRKIQRLKLRRNSFSDEAVAAFLELSGGFLKELSLNNVSKIEHNTALSLAKHSRGLLNLDLSWCRNLTDDALGLIVDSCPSLKVLKLFGCTQVTEKFTNGHSNPQVQIIGLKNAPILKHMELTDPESYTS